jgi:predicted Zn-dependent protease with MMP-like domain
MNRKEFTQLVTEVLDTLPDEFATRLQNVEVVVVDEPTRAQLRSVGLDPKRDTLFGLYEGTPLPERGEGHAVLPDKISIFYLPIIETCDTPSEIRDEIRTTILHEVAHVFGIGDDDLDQWGY